MALLVGHWTVDAPAIEILWFVDRGDIFPVAIEPDTDVSLDNAEQVYHPIYVIVALDSCRVVLST